MASHIKKVKDPVCGTDVDAARAYYFAHHGGRRFVFCSPRCQKAFEENPARYIRPKGFFGKFLDRLAKTNEREFGSGGPTCCH